MHRRGNFRLTTTRPLSLLNKLARKMFVELGVGIHPVRNLHAPKLGRSTKFGAIVVLGSIIAMRAGLFLAGLTPLPSRRGLVRI